MLIRFGTFELDASSAELWRNGTRVDVQPRVLEIIAFLASRSGRLVTKEELLAGPWKGMVVSDAAVSQAIRQARAALGEASTSSKFIETVRGRGFRFRGVLGEDAPSDASPRSTRRRPFFGRERETERLQLAADSARSGHGNVVLIHGPAGVGKTRIAQWFASQQHRAGGEVCWGGCREGQSAPPFWPWPEVIHRYADAHAATVLARLTHGFEQDLVAAAPELSGALGVTAATGGDESPERAASVLDAIAVFLRRASAEAPLTLVLEDLHLADDAALRVLEVLAHSIEATRLVILGTFRSVEGASRAGLSAALSGSLPHTQTVALEGLSIEDVREWLTSTAATPPPEAIIDAVHFSTDGLPLLVEALTENLPNWDARTFAEQRPDGPGLTGRIRQILGRRLNQLDSYTLQLLRTAAVFGEEFRVAPLAAVTRVPSSALEPLLARAREQGVLKLADGGSLCFAHALQRDLLYQELETSERRKLHGAVARFFRDQLSQHPESIVETAHHFLEALPYADLNQVVSCAQQAAAWARARHAYARAADYYERAIAVLDLEPADPHRYAELLLALGHTQFVAGMGDAAVATLERVFDLTRAHGRYDLFCRAILIWFQLRQDAASVDPIFHTRIAEALEHVRERDVVFAQLQVARAMATMFTVRSRERVRWIEEALALTRDVADLRPRLEVLWGALRCHTMFTDGTTDLALAEEMLQIALALRSPEGELDARQYRAGALLALGRGVDYQHEVAAYSERAMVVRTPQATWFASVLDAGQLFLSGSLAHSERVAREAGKVGEELRGLAGFLVMITQLFQVGAECDEAGAQRILREFVEGGNRVLSVAPTFQAMIALVARARMHCGEDDAAREYLARLTNQDYPALDPLDRNFLPTAVAVADLACGQKDVDAAALLLPMLQPYEGQHAVAGTGAAYFGPISYWLGRLSLLCDRIEDAERQLTLATVESQSARSIVYRAWSEYYLARAMTGDAIRARDLLDSAKRFAHRFGLGRLIAALRSTVLTAPFGPTN